MMTGLHDNLKTSMAETLFVNEKNTKYETWYKEEN